MVLKQFHTSELKMIEVTSKLAKMWNELDDHDKEYWKSKEVEENSKVTYTSLNLIPIPYCSTDI